MKHRVQFISGVIWSNVMLAMYNPVIRSETIHIGANAGPGEIAGELCSPYFFSVSLQNIQPPKALGHFLAEKKITNAFIVIPNYSTGREDTDGKSAK